MGYDQWKADYDSSPEAASERAAERRQYEEEQAEDEEALAELASDLKARINLIRSSALMALEIGSVQPRGSIIADIFMTTVLSQVGCASCGRKFTRDEARTLVCVRKHGLHPGCELPAVRR